MRLTWRWLLLLSVAVVACGTAASPRDSGLDSGTDAGSTSGSDAGEDGGSADAGPLPACGADTPLAMSQCVDVARYETDLAAIAMERVPESAHWQTVQDLCATRLAALGFVVERQTYATGVNVIGVRAGGVDATRRVLVAAHYEHIAGCDGADDNASGVAGVLEAARVLVGASYPRTLIVACWDARVSARVAGHERPTPLRPRRVYAAFWEQGYPAMMITDTGEFRYDRYHCASGPDVPANLDVGFASQIVAITVAAAVESLGL